MSVITYNNFQFHVQHNGYPVIHGHIGTYEFIFVISGEIRHKINGRKEILEQNSLCFLTPTDKHSLEKLTDDAIYISLSIVQKHFEELLTWIAPDIKNRAFNIYERLKISADSAAEIMKLTNKALTSTPDVHYEFLHVITCFLTRKIITYHYGRAMTSNYHPAVEKFIQLLDDEKSLSTPLATLIWESGYSYTHLNKLFLEDTGVSVGKFLSKKKLDYAITAIKCSEKSLQKISEVLGFSTYSHFSAYFKKNTGISPLQYRQTSAVPFLF